MIKLKNKKMARFWFYWNFDFCDLMITNGFNSELLIEPTNHEIIGRVEFIEKSADNENIEFWFEMILSKNVTNWNFDDEHFEKK